MIEEVTQEQALRERNEEWGKLRKGSLFRILLEPSTFNFDYFMAIAKFDDGWLVLKLDLENRTRLVDAAISLRAMEAHNLTKLLVLSKLHALEILAR